MSLLSQPKHAALMKRIDTPIKYGMLITEWQKVVDAAWECAGQTSQRFPMKLPAAETETTTTTTTTTPPPRRRILGQGNSFLKFVDRTKWEKVLVDDKTMRM
eukprot:PhM_4_TR15480/c0_g1_i1/m.56144